MCVMSRGQLLTLSTREAWNHLPPEVNFKLASALLFNYLLSFEQSTLPGLVSVSLSVSKEKAMTI